MAQVRWFLNASLLDGWALVDQTAAAAATLANGWVVGTGSTFSSEFQSAGGDRASTTFVGNTVPDGTLDLTLKDAFRSQYAWDGAFAAGNWTFQFAVVSTVQAGAADGQIVFRILKADADGSNATEITSAQQVTTTATNVGGTDVNITATWAAPAWTITNQYIFVQVAWKRTGAGGMTTTNIRLRTGSSTTVGTTGLTADFTASQVVTIDARIASTARIRFTESSIVEVTGGPNVNSASQAGPNAGQSISGHSGVLASVYFSIAKIGTPTDEMYLELRETTWSGTLLATSFKVPATLLTSGYNWKQFVFPFGVALNAGTTYFIRMYLTRSAGDGANAWGVVTNGLAGTYAGGSLHNPAGVADPAADFNFMLYGGTSHTVAVEALPGDNVTGVTIATTAILSPPSIAPNVWATAILSTSRLAGEMLTVTSATYGWSEVTDPASSSQSFTNVSGSLTSISLFMKKGAASVDEMFLELRQDTYTGTLLGTTELKSSNLTNDTPAWFGFGFSTPITLSAGTVYWWRVRMTRASYNSTGPQQGAATNNPYADGQSRSYSGTLQTTIDYFFQLYGPTHTVEAPPPPVQTVWSGFIPSSAHPFSTPETLLFELAGVSFYYQCSIDGPALAQSISGHDGEISSISLTLRKGGSPTDYVYLELRQSSALGTLLATSAPIAASTLTTTPVWRNFPLTNTVLLVSGSTYFIRLVLTRTQQDGPNFVGWFLGTAGTYTAGAATTAVGGTLNGGVDDMTFRLYTGESHTVVLATGGTQYVDLLRIASTAVVRVPTVALVDQTVTGVFIGASLAPVAVAAFNFRGTAVYVTDGAGQTYVLGSTLYPTNRDGLTFGWVLSALLANRSTSVDVRLAGLNYSTGGVDENFRFDLPAAGTYLVGLAMGDVVAAQSNMQVEIYDNTTLVLTIGRRAVSAGQFWDASDVKYSSAAWPTSQTPVPLVFATTTLILRLKGDGNSSCISHLSVASVPTGGSAAVLYPVDVAHAGAGTQTIDGATIASTSQLSTPAINTVAVPTILSGARVGTTQLFENPWSGGTLGATLAGRNFSQTISGHDGLLTSVALKLRKVGLPTDALYVDIRDAFNGTLLATSASLALTDIPPGSSAAVNNWYLFPLNTPVPLVAATTYWIGVYRTAGSVSKFPYLLYDLLEPYPAGVLYDASGAPQSGGTADLAFRLYVAAAPTLAQTAPDQAITTFPIGSSATVSAPSVSGGAAEPTAAVVVLRRVVPHFYRDVYRRSYSLRYRRIVIVAAAPPSLQTINGATIAASSQTFVPTVDQAQAVTTFPIPVGSLLNVPSIATGPVTITGTTRPTTATVNVPSVAVGPVTITGATIPVASVLYAATITVGPVAVTGATRLSTAQLFTASIATGPVDVTGATRGSTSTVSQPSIAVGPVAVTGASRASTSVLTAPSIALVTTGATIASGSGLFPPQMVALNIATATRATSIVLNAPTVGVTITAGTVGSVSQGFAPSVATGPVAVTGSTILTTAQVFVPIVSTGTTAIDGVTVGTTATLYPATVATGAVTITGSTVTGAPQTFVPSIAVGAVTVVGGTRPATSALFAPVLTAVATGATIVSGSGTFAPTLAGAVTTATRGVASQVFVPVVAAAGVTNITLVTIASGSVLSLPSITTGSVAVTGATLASTAQTFVLSVAVGPVTVLGATRSSTSQTFVLSVAVGPVTVLGATVSTSAVLFTPALTQVDVGAIGAATITTTTVAYVPTVVGGLAIIGAATIVATSSVTVPSVTVGATSVTSATLASGSLRFAPTVVPQAVGITGGTRPTTIQVFTPSLAVGAVAITGATRTTASQVFAPVLTQVSTGSTIVSGSGTFVPSVALTVTTSTRTTTIQVFTPTLAVGAVTVTSGTRATTIQVFAPTLAVGAVTVVGATRAPASLLLAPTVTTLVTTVAISSTAALFTPTALPLDAIGGPTRGSTVQLFALSVTTGPVSVTGAHRASTLQVFVPTIAVGVTSITGATRGSTAVVFPPTFIAALDGTFVGSTTALFPPTVKLTQFVTTAPIPVGAAPFAASVLALWEVTGGTRLSTTQTFAPSVTTGPVTITGSTVPATSQTYAPALQPGAVTITVPHRASTLLVLAPTVSYVVEVAHRTSAVALFPPALATGPVAVSTGAIVSTIQVFPPSLGAGITTATLARTSLPFAPTLIPLVTTPLWIVRTQLFPPSAIPLGEMILTFLPSGSAVFPPFMVGHAPPPEILDFTSNLVREIMGTATVCRSTEGTVILTRDETAVVALYREVEMSASIVRREIEIGVER